MAKALLINPSYKDSYGSAKAAIVDPIFPTLSLLTIAAMAEKFGHQIEIFDMSHRQYDYRVVKEKILAFKPDVVGITGTTPLMNQIRDISLLVKDISKNIRVVAGGSHVSALPRESLLESHLDSVVQGEGDITFAEIMDGRSLKDIKGIWYRENHELRQNAPRDFIQNLDDLPMPAWHLYNSSEYTNKTSRLLAKRRPMTMAEFSRGCVYKCDFCASKNTMALGYRKKSPERCAEEVKLMKRHGYREFALADDIFTSDNAWAKTVCEKIIQTGVDMSWTCTNGIRVESANEDLFRTMRKAGCYRVAFGFESGSDEVLKTFGKGGRASLKKGKEAAAAAKRAGLDVCGFFMLGLSPDTEDSMSETIKFASSLPLDMMKFGIAIAFPGTKMFRDYSDAGRVRSFNWDDYFIYTTQPLFAHKNLTYEKVQEYMHRAYREAILRNPGFIRRRLWRGIKTGEFFWDAYYFLKFASAPPINSKTHEAIYFARDSWPQYDWAGLDRVAQL